MFGRVHAESTNSYIQYNIFLQFCIINSTMLFCLDVSERKKYINPDVRVIISGPCLT